MDLGIYQGSSTGDPEGDAMKIPTELTKMEKAIVHDKAYFLQVKDHPWLSLISFIVILCLWEMVSRMMWIPPLFLPAPSDILLEGWGMLKTGVIFNHVFASLSRILLGFSIACIAGVMSGILIGFFSIPEAIGNPLIAATFPIPKIAILPLLILWLGIGEPPKVAVIALGVFFPMVINVYTGVKNVDPLLIKAALSLGSNRTRVIRKVILPGNSAHGFCWDEIGHWHCTIARRRGRNGGCGCRHWLYDPDCCRSHADQEVNGGPRHPLLTRNLFQLVIPKNGETFHSMETIGQASGLSEKEASI